MIAAFVDTSVSPFGQIALKKLFEAADKDGSGTLDKTEVRAALEALVRLLHLPHAHANVAYTHPSIHLVYLWRVVFPVFLCARPIVQANPLPLPVPPFVKKILMNACFVSARASNGWWTTPRSRS